MLATLTIEKSISVTTNIKTFGIGESNHRITKVIMENKLALFSISLQVSENLVNVLNWAILRDVLFRLTVFVKNHHGKARIQV